MSAFGIDIGEPPLNLSSLLALLACVLVWLFIWHTRWGYELRVVGHNERAARYGGISPPARDHPGDADLGRARRPGRRQRDHGRAARLLVGFTGGFGFVGIAVALMGRNHPVGIALAALLFGALYQGGSELAFDMPQITARWSWSSRAW